MRKLNQRGDATVVLAWLVGLLILVGLIVGIVLLVHHNNQWNSQRGRGDASVGRVDTQPRDVYQMPDRFGNVAMFCDKYGNAVYVTTSNPNRSLWAVKDGCQ